MGKRRAARIEGAKGFRGPPDRPFRLGGPVVLALIAAAILIWTFGPRRRAADAPPLDPGAPESTAAAEHPWQSGRGYGAPEIVAADEAANVSEVAARKVRELAAIVRMLFAKQRDYAAYRKCIAEGGTCTDELSRLLYMASVELQEQMFRNAFDVGALVAANGARAVEQALIEHVRNTRDPVERYAALHLLSEWDSGVEPIELPPDLYDGLERRPMAEAQLLLARHQRTPVMNPETREHLTELGARTETDQRLWTSIYQGLGHEETAAELRRVVTSRPLDSITSVTAGVAAARCGLACLDTLKAIAAQGPEGRVAVLHALDAMDPAVVARALAALAPGQPQSAEEQALVSQLNAGAGP